MNATLPEALESTADNLDSLGHDMDAANCRAAADNLRSLPEFQESGTRPVPTRAEDAARADIEQRVAAELGDETLAWRAVEAFWPTHRERFLR